MAPAVLSSAAASSSTAAAAMSNQRNVFAEGWERILSHKNSQATREASAASRPAYVTRVRLAAYPASRPVSANAATS